ncbi:MAG: hypothetical protein ACOZEN_00125 [Thermodesulfobacteriota bacterium]
MHLIHPVPEGLRLLDTAIMPQPSPEALERADSIWETLKASRPGLFDGTLFSLDRFESGAAVGFVARYKWYAAQLEDPSLFPELRVRSLALTGVVTANGHAIFGRRRPGLAIEGGLWEFAPSGTIDGVLREPDGSVSWRGVFQEEMREELGLDIPAGLPAPFALVEDTVTNIWEMGVAAELHLDHRDVLAAWAACPAPEHSELAAVPLADVPRFLQVRGHEMVGATPFLAAALGLAPTPGQSGA